VRRVATISDDTEAEGPGRRWVLWLQATRSTARGAATPRCSWPTGARRAVARGAGRADVRRRRLDEFDAKLYPPPPTTTDRPLPDPAYLHLQLRRAHVTMRLLHDEYLQQHLDGYGYTRLLEHWFAASVGLTGNGR